MFSASVSAAIGEAAATAASPELVAAIVLGVLLAATFVAFLAYVVLDLKRKRYTGIALAMAFRLTADGFINVNTKNICVMNY